MDYEELPSFNEFIIEYLEYSIINSYVLMNLLDSLFLFVFEEYRQFYEFIF